MTPSRHLISALAFAIVAHLSSAQESSAKSAISQLPLLDEAPAQTIDETPSVTPAAVQAPVPAPAQANDNAEDVNALVGLNELPDSVAPALPPIEGRGVDDNLLPLRLPGYELRVLDKRKKMLYNIKGQWVEASLPVYFYYPTAPASKDRALNLLRKVYDDVLALGEKPQWTAAEFRNVLVSLDAALTLLESGSAQPDSKK